MDTAVAPKKVPGFFVREATGLVRELSWFDTFLCGFAS